jgi:hypothetical protein
MSDWTDRIVGARMKVDSTFAPEVESSGFSRQEWGLVMTSVEFEIEGAGDPDTARLVANNDNLEAVIPELKRVAEMQEQMQGGGRSSGGGFLDNVKSALGLGNGTGGKDSVDPERLAEARSLTQRYAEELQSHLESNGRWTDICEAAHEQSTRE